LSSQHPERKLFSGVQVLMESWFILTEPEPDCCLSINHLRCSDIVLKLLLSSAETQNFVTKNGTI